MLACALTYQASPTTCSVAIPDLRSPSLGGCLCIPSSATRAPPLLSLSTFSTLGLHNPLRKLFKWYKLDSKMVRDQVSCALFYTGSKVRSLHGAYRFTRLGFLVSEMIPSASALAPASSLTSAPASASASVLIWCSAPAEVPTGLTSGLRGVVSGSSLACTDST